MSDVKFFPFPTLKKDPKGRKRWLDLLRRENYDPPPYHRLCSLHFVDGGPTEKNPYPTLFAYNNFKQPRNVRSSAVVVKRKRDIPEESDAVERREKTTVTEACSIDLVGPHIVSL